MPRPLGNENEAHLPSLDCTVQLLPTFNLLKARNVNIGDCMEFPKTQSQVRSGTACLPAHSPERTLARCEVEPAAPLAYGVCVLARPPNRSTSAGCGFARVVRCFLLPGT